MKNYDEIARSVLSKRDAILNERAERRKKITRFASPMAVLCLAVMIGVGITQADLMRNEPPLIGGTEPPLIGDAGYVGTADLTYDGDTEENAIINEIYPENGYGEKNVGERNILNDPISTDELLIDIVPTTLEVTETETSSSHPSDVGIKIHSYFAQDLFYVHSIVGEATPAKRAFDKENYYGLDYSAEEMEEYIGIDMESIMNELPKDMVYIPHAHNIIMKTDGTIAYDAAHFMIEDGKGGRITISAGKVLPPYDCVYMLNDETVNELETDKGTVSILAGGKDYDEEKGMFGFFFADFEYDGVYYRIEFENIYNSKIVAAMFKMIIG